MRGKREPVLQEGVIYRSQDTVQLFDQIVIASTTPKESDAVACAPFRKFSLMLFIDSTSAPTTLHIEVEFFDRHSEKWYSYKQGPFAALYYEDTDTADGIEECLSGDVLGRMMRVKLTGAGTDSSNYFTVSASIDLWS